MSKISELSDGGSLVSSDYLIAVRGQAGMSRSEWIRSTSIK